MAATPPATHKAMITLAAPMDRRSGAANVAGLLNISSSPPGFAESCPRELRRSGTVFEADIAMPIPVIGFYPELRVTNSKACRRHELV
jgi:hypothetical protein